MNTWKRYNKMVQKLLLANIKPELSGLLVGNRERTHRASTEPLGIMDGDDYVDKLRRELGQARAKQADMTGDEEDMVWEVGHEWAKTCETYHGSQAGLLINKKNKCGFVSHRVSSWHRCLLVSLRCLSGVSWCLLVSSELAVFLLETVLEK